MIITFNSTGVDRNDKIRNLLIEYSKTITHNCNYSSNMYIPKNKSGNHGCKECEEYKYNNIDLRNVRIYAKNKIECIVKFADFINSKCYSQNPIDAYNNIDNIIEKFGIENLVDNYFIEFESIGMYFYQL